MSETRGSILELGEGRKEGRVEGEGGFPKMYLSAERRYGRRNSVRKDQGQSVWASFSNGKTKRG